MNNTSTFLGLSIGLNVLLIFGFAYLSMTIDSPNQETKGFDRVWHGGHPADVHAGSCWCGSADGYCMCTPNIAIDLVITSGEKHEFIWLVRRKDTDQLATMGGFVDVDETVEHAVKRELKEEMGVDLTHAPRLLGVYSDPRRDNRRRTVSAVYVVHFEENVHPHAGDDAKEVKRISINDIEQHTYFADHLTILLDYRRLVQGQQPRLDSAGDFADDIDRSTCAEINKLIAYD